MTGAGWYILLGSIAAAFLISPWFLLIIAFFVVIEAIGFWMDSAR